MVSWSVLKKLRLNLPFASYLRLVTGDVYKRQEWEFDALSMSGVRFVEEVLLRKTLDITNTTKDELKNRARKVGNIRLGDIILPFIQYSNPCLLYTSRNFFKTDQDTTGHPSVLRKDMTARCKPSLGNYDSKGKTSSSCLLYTSRCV